MQWVVLGYLVVRQHAAPSGQGGKCRCRGACSSCYTDCPQRRQHAAFEHLYASHHQVPAASSSFTFMPQGPPAFAPSHPLASPPFDLAIQVGLQYVRWVVLAELVTSSLGGHSSSACGPGGYDGGGVHDGGWLAGRDLFKQLHQSCPLATRLTSLECYTVVTVLLSRSMDSLLCPVRVRTPTSPPRRPPSASHGPADRAR